MKLIVNADDFGLSRGVNFAIVDAMQYGIVRSTTLMASGCAFDHAVELGKSNPELGIGIHLILTWGYPLLTDHKTLVDEQGQFHKLAYVEENVGNLDPDEIEKEFSAQIERVLESGINPTHIDSHHHVHMLKENEKIIEKIANKYNLPYRGIRAFTADFYGKELTAVQLKEIMNAHTGEDVVEIMTHPAYIDAVLYRESSYNRSRVQEYDILTSQEILDFIRVNKIELINYGDLGKESEKV